MGAADRRENEKDGTFVSLLHEDSADEVTEDGSVDIYGRPALKRKTGNSRAAKFILVVELFESLACFGVSCNLPIYLKKVLHQGNASVASSITAFTGTSYLTPFLGALLADSYLGRYWTTFNFFFVYAMGIVVLTLSSSLSLLRPPICEDASCPPASSFQKLVFFSGLYLVSLGSGFIKSSLLPLGADQFCDLDPKESVKKGSFFNWFYFSMNLGALISSSVLVWIQENVDWGLGYGISTGCIAIAIALFILGTPFYRLRRPGGSPLTRVCQVLVAAVRKITLEVPNDRKLLYDDENGAPADSIPHLYHTDDFRFLDKAATIFSEDMEHGSSRNPWRLCTVTQVEELKLLLRLFPVWLTGIIYSTVYAQMYTVFIEQGSTMERQVGAFVVPPAMLYAFEVFCVIAWVPVNDTVIIPIARKFSSNPQGFSELQRMGIGQFLIIVSMAVAAIVETARLGSIREGKLLSITLQLPQYFLVGVSEVFGFVAQLEFFYDQAPDSMRSVCTAMSLLTLSLGNYLSSAMVSFVSWLTTRGGGPGWLPDDFNQGHLDYFFWMLAGVSALNLVAYIVCAKRYNLKKIAPMNQL